jgi:predicted Na+-dependent transporter
VNARSGFSRVIGTYPELLLVILAAGIGLSVGRPFRWADNHLGINVLLVVLVFTTAVTVSADSLRRVASSWKQLVAALALGVTVLPALSWLASQLVTAGPLRDGIMVVGIAPCEIASVATTALAGGAAALAAAILIGSTLLSVAFAGLILSFVADDAYVHPTHVLINLVVVVGIPLTLGLVLAATSLLTPRTIAVAKWTATGALAGLVTLVAGQVHFGVAYVGVLFAVLIIVAASALMGIGIGRTASREEFTSLLLTTSMRDFAIAAGLAASAFGPAAAAPLGLYGVVVIIWGTGTAGFLRSRARPSRPR